MAIRSAQSIVDLSQIELLSSKISASLDEKVNTSDLPETLVTGVKLETATTEEGSHPALVVTTGKDNTEASVDVTPVLDAYSAGMKSELAEVKTDLAAAKEDIEEADERLTALEAQTIPTKVSQLENDSEFATTSEMNSAISTAVAEADHLKRRKVDSVDDIDVSASDADQYIYMVPTGKEGANKFYEYVVVDGAVEPVGDWEVNLSDYVQKDGDKVLSTNDFTDADKEKLDGVAEGATKVEATEGSGDLVVNGTPVQMFRFATDEEFSEMLARVGLD